MIASNFKPFFSKISALTWYLDPGRKLISCRDFRFVKSRFKSRYYMVRSHNFEIWWKGYHPQYQGLWYPSWYPDLLDMCPTLGATTRRGVLNCNSPDTAPGWGLGCQVASSHNRIFVKLLLFNAVFLLVFFLFWQFPQIFSPLKLNLLWNHPHSS